MIEAFRGWKTNRCRKYVPCLLFHGNTARGTALTQPLHDMVFQISDCYPGHNRTPECNIAISPSDCNDSNAVIAVVQISFHAM